jgi:hypothetical protein
MDNAQKSEFFKELPTVLVKFPKVLHIDPQIITASNMILETTTAKDFAIFVWRICHCRSDSVHIAEHIYDRRNSDGR